MLLGLFGMFFGPFRNNTIKHTPEPRSETMADLPEVVSGQV